MNDDNYHHQGASSSSLSSSSSTKSSSRIAILEKLGCPDGTVPICRTSKQDLIRAKLFLKSSQLHSKISNVGDRHCDDLEVPDESQFLSIAKSKKNSGIEYIGIEARINVYNPPVGENQISTAQLWIENGSKEELNSLQAGWIVAPSLLRDNITRLFSKWQINGPKNEGCYNIFCLGFIQVDKDHAMGGTFDAISQTGGKQYNIKFSIFQDADKSWWLNIEDTELGYWPAELGFSHLTLGSSVIAWGGLAQGAVATSIPPTGNGNFPYALEDFKRQCYMRQMKVIPVKTQNWEDPTRKIIRTSATNSDCSDVYYYGQLDDEPDGYQHTVGFGGPGGNCQEN